jgi:hypothetical protein
MKLGRWITVVGISLLATLVLAVVLLRGSTQSTATIEFGMFIDADSTNGYCNLPPDSSRSVAHPANFNVAACVENPPAALGAFAFELVYDDTVIKAPEVADSGTALNDNPNANEAALGTGWDCSGFGLSYPKGDIDPLTGAGHGRAKIGCLSLTGPWTFTSTGYVALINFNTQGITNTSSLGLENVVLADVPGEELGSCNPTITTALPCTDGSITATGGAPTATFTPTPTPSRTPTPSATPTITPTPRPFACLWEDDLGRGTSLGIRDDLTGSWAFKNNGVVVASGSSSRRLGTSKIVLGQSNGVNVFGMGKCPNGPARATALDMSSLPLLRVFGLQDMSP